MDMLWQLISRCFLIYYSYLSISIVIRFFIVDINVNGDAMIKM